VRDPLTGVLNRAAFEDQLRREVARSAGHGRPYALAVLDLDHFKQVNDRFGHAAGDRALKRVCALVGETIRDTDVFARVGGEEFALLMSDTEPAGAEHAAEKLRTRIEQEARAENMPLTISIGLAVGRGTDADEVLLAADRALYEAKRRGRNLVVRAPAPGAVPAAGPVPSL
jgi:diguanylate cyclase